MRVIRSWLGLGGRAVLLLVLLLGGLVAVVGFISVARRGQAHVYTPVNLMGGATAPPIILVAENTSVPASSDALTSTPLPGSGFFHTVQAGETLYGIASSYNLTAADVAAANGIDETALIYQDQQLAIPVSAEVAQTQVVALVPTATLVPDLGLLPPPPLDASVPTAINGISVEVFGPMSESLIQHLRNIYSIGQSLGRNPRSFAKLGDSLIENPHFLARFDSASFNLGGYAYLQPVITYYSGSFGRESAAVRRGLHSWSVLDPMWATGAGCGGGENMLACEFRQQNPSILFIHLGSNDAGMPESVDRSLRQIVEFCLTNGVIPILSTKADRHEGADINNPIIRQVASDYNVPLWDFDLLAGTLPGRGLGEDGTHMTVFFANDWSSPTAFERGYGLMNLSALMVLDRVWRAVAG